MTATDDHSLSSRRMTLAGLAFGLGRFFDGIVLHQIFQWHHLRLYAGGAFLVSNNYLPAGCFDWADEAI